MPAGDGELILFLSLVTGSSGKLLTLGEFKAPEID